VCRMCFVHASFLSGCLGGLWPLASVQNLAFAKQSAQRPLRLHLLELGLAIVTGLIVIDLVGSAPAGSDLALTDFVGSGPVETGLESFDLFLGLAPD